MRMSDEDTDARELFGECVAITEYDGGLPRHNAEVYACVAAWRCYERTGAEQPALGLYSALHRPITVDGPREPGKRQERKTLPPSAVLPENRAGVLHRIFPI